MIQFNEACQLWCDLPFREVSVVPGNPLTSLGAGSEASVMLSQSLWNSTSALRFTPAGLADFEFLPPLPIQFSCYHDDNPTKRLKRQEKMTHVGAK